MSRSLPSTSRRRRGIEAMSQSAVLSGSDRNAGMPRQLRAERLANNTVTAPPEIKMEVPVRRRSASRTRMHSQLEHQSLNNIERSEASLELPLLPNPAVMSQHGERKSRRRRVIEAMSDLQPMIPRISMEQTSTRRRTVESVSNSESLRNRPIMPEEQRTHQIKSNIRERKSTRRRTIDAMCDSEPVRSIIPKERRTLQTKSNIAVPAATIGLKLPGCPIQLPTPYYCEKCNAKKFAFEGLHFCCGNGEIELAINEYPVELQRLFTSDDEDAMHFKKYARLYNNLFAFSSLGGKFDVGSYKGIFVFKVHGQMYHNVPDLIPDNGNVRYLQLYFYDGLQESTKRTESFPEVREDIVVILMNVSRDNPYARFFRSLREISIDETTTIVLNKNTIPDQRVYNAPSTDEVAGIWPDSASSSQSNSPHVIIRGKSSEPHQIQHYYGCYDPLQYPLLFPRGECGWTQGHKKKTWGGSQQVAMEVDPVMSCAVHTTEELLAEEGSRSARKNTKADKYVSAREYYAYKLQIRPNNLLLRAERCFQQYIVDMYVKIENTRLDFFRNNQDSIRADLYQGVLDSLDCGETIAANVGRRVILPPTYIGGPRDMKRRYYNAMALVQKFGKPDLFVTMTCNANWPEIKNELCGREQAQDRPDLVARIFHAKLVALKKQIKE